MKLVFISLFSMCQIAFAGNVTLNPGSQITLQAGEMMTISCAGNVMSTCPLNEQAKVACLNKGYSPSSCSVLKECSSSQAACLNNNYSPSACKDL